MNKRRLLKLADLLEANAKNPKGARFNLKRWGVVTDTRNPVSCGTTACAMGLAVASGAFKSAGLKSNFNDGDLYPRHNGKSGFGAATSLFDISYIDANHLFCPDCYPINKLEGANAERYVAKRIRDFVAGKVGPDSAKALA